MNSFRHNTCPLCSSVSIQYLNDIEYLRRDKFTTNEISLGFTPELWRCCTCGSWFVQNIIAEAVAASFYRDGVSAECWSQKPFEDNKSSEILDLFSGIVGKDKRVLDIGCNTGELLDYAKSRGCMTAGVEYSVTSREILADKGHHAYASLDEADEAYDVITAFDLIEHLHDVPYFLKACNEKLSDNGVIVILTGNILSLTARLCQSKWWYLKYPEHIVFPSRKFYEEFSIFHVEKWIPTYVSVGYRYPFVPKIIGIMKNLLKGIYTGLPSFGPDHILIVMRK